MKGVVTPYLIALVFATIVIGTVGYSLYSASGGFGETVSDVKCGTAEFIYCNTGGEWNPACGAVPDCVGGGGGGGGGDVETTTIPTSTEDDTLWFRDLRGFGLWAYGTLEMERETLTQQDYNQMKSWGFNAVSSSIKISRVFQSDSANWVPEKLESIKRHVEYANNTGMKIILAPSTSELSYVDDWFKHSDLHDSDKQELFYDIHETIYDDLTSRYPNVIQSVLYFPFHQQDSISATDRSVYEDVIVPNTIDRLRREGYDGVIGITWVHAAVDAKELTDDPNVFYAYTNYEPGSVSHQGGTYDGDTVLLRERDMAAYNFRESTGEEVFCFEWGVKWRDAGELREDQINYISDMKSIHEEYNIPNAYWSYSSVDDFGVLESDGDETAIIDAIRPVPDQASDGINIKKYVAYNWRLFWQGDEYRDFSGCWDMMQMHYEPAVGDDIPNQIKQADPNIEILLYRNTRAVYTREPEELQLFKENNWILKTMNGEEIISRDFRSNFVVDKGNPDYQEWFANWMKYYVETYGYDGAFLDNSAFGSSENMWYTMGVDSGCDSQSPEPDGCPPINPRTKTFWTNEDWREADIGLINKVKEKLGDKYVILNGVNNGRKFFDSTRHDNYVAVMQQSNMDGFIIELWMNDGSGQFYSEENWKKSVDMISWFDDNLPNARVISLVGAGWQNLPPGITNDEFATYSYASLLLGASSDRYYMLQTPGGANLIDSAGEDVYCRPDVQALHDIDLGTPLSDYYISSGTRVYVRDFSNVKVLVNPTSTTYTVNLDRAYQTIGGQTVSGELTVNPHTGIILKSEDPTNSLKLMRFTIHNNFHANYVPDSIDHRNDGDYISQRTDMHQSGWMDAPCNTLRNNDIPCLSYFNVRGISTNINPNTESWRLKDIDGNYITDNNGINFMVDPMNEEFRAWAKERVQEWKNMGYTGVWLDNGIDQDITTQAEYSMTGVPVNPRTWVLYEDDDWRNDRVDFANWLQEQFPNMVMVANALWNGGTYAKHVDDYDYIFNNLKIDGLFSEGTFTGVNPAPIWSEFTWKQSIEMIDAIQDKWLSNPDKFFVWYSQVPNAVRDNVLATSRDQISKFIFTSVLMGVYKSDQNYVETHNHMADDDTQALYKVDLGIPLGDHHIIQDTHVYKRDFENVKVFVNPTDDEYTISLKSGCTDLDGNSVSSLTMIAYSGKILSKDCVVN